MANVQIVKSIYTASDVTSLGEVAAADTVAIPCPVTVAGAGSFTGVTTCKAGSMYLLDSTAATAGLGFFTTNAAISTIMQHYDGELRLGVNEVTKAAISSTGLSVTGDVSCTTLTPTGQTTLKEVKDTVFNITDAAAFEIDPANGSLQTITLGAARTPAATNFEAGQCVLLEITGGNTYAITWTSVEPTWVSSTGSQAAPSISTTGKACILLWKTGTTMHGALIGKTA